MIEKIKMPEDIDHAVKMEFSSFTPGETKCRNVIFDTQLITRIAVEVLANKINEIIDVVQCDHEWISEPKGEQAVAVCKKCDEIA